MEACYCSRVHERHSRTACAHLQDRSCLKTGTPHWVLSGGDGQGAGSLRPQESRRTRDLVQVLSVYPSIYTSLYPPFLPSFLPACLPSFLPSFLHLPIQGLFIDSYADPRVCSLLCFRLPMLFSEDTEIDKTHKNFSVPTKSTVNLGRQTSKR